MAVNPVLVSDATRWVGDLKRRKVWWDKLIDSLTHSTSAALPPAVQYLDVYNGHLADSKIFQKQAKQAQWLDERFGSVEADLRKRLAKKGYGTTTDLPSLYATADAADSAMKAIEGSLHTFASSRLAAKGSFFKSLENDIAKGRYDKALKRIQNQQPGWFSRWRMGKAGVAAWNTDLATLAGKVRAHQAARIQYEKVEKPIELVERETAKAIRKMLDKDGGKLLHAGNADLVALAGSNSSAAMLLRFAGGRASVSVIAAELQKDRSVSLASLRAAMHALQGNFSSKHIASKTATQDAEHKMKACHNFLEGCRKARRYELTAASGHGTRDDLITKLEEAIKNAGTLEDKDMQKLLDAAKARHARWANPTQEAEINADATALGGGPAAFAPHMLHSTALPKFNIASRAWEHLSTAAKEAYNYAFT